MSNPIVSSYPNETSIIAHSQLPAGSPALAMAAEMTAKEPRQAGRVYRAAMLVDLGHVAIRPGPYNVYSDDLNITGRVLSQSGSGLTYTVRLARGDRHHCYREYAIEVCECPDFGRTKLDGIPFCKHTAAVRIARRLLANRPAQFRPEALTS